MASQFYVIEKPAHAPTFPRVELSTLSTEEQAAKDAFNVLEMSSTPQIIKTAHKPLPDVDRGNILSFLETNPNKIPGEKALLLRVSDGKAVSRAQAALDARRLAHVLRHKLNLKEGDRIAIFSPNSTMYPIAVYAGFAAGVVLTPMSPAYNAEELVHPLVDSGSQYILAHPAIAPVARKAMELAGISTKRGNMNRLWLLDDTDEMASAPSGGDEKDIRTLLSDDTMEPVKVNNAKERTALICYSSGTSGKPKGVELTHRNMTSVTAAMVQGLAPDFSPKDVVLGVLPFQHIFGMAKFIHYALYSGMTVVVMPRFDLKVFLEAVQTYRITLGILVPPILVLLAKDPTVQKYDLSSLRIIMSGAAPLSAQLGDEVQEKIRGVRVTQGYGLTETSPTSHYTSVNNYERVKGSCGQLMPCVEARLINEEGRDVGHEQGPFGEPGEIWLRGPTIMKGYLNNEAATKDAITPDGWFKTGDVAIYKDGHFFIVDRKKELIKYKGFQVAPAEIEAMLLTHPKVADSAVIGVYKPSEATELPRAYVVPRADAGIDVNNADQVKAFADEVRQWFDSRVANHKKLRGGVCVESLIQKSPSGKILRRLYRDRIVAEAKAAEDLSKRK
jgi:acyl-CoA synthetase (AMP-forming)/AMP-acid ligase II